MVQMPRRRNDQLARSIPLDDVMANNSSNLDPLTISCREWNILTDCNHHHQLNIIMNPMRSILREGLTRSARAALCRASHRQGVSASQCYLSFQQHQRTGAHATRTFSTTLLRKDNTPPSAAGSRESLVPQTHYDYFPQNLGAAAIPPLGKFAIDTKALKREFLQLQSKAHPDMAPEGKKRQAEALSARINEAYKTLENPLLRAQYLLGLRGIDVAEDETAKVEDPELLMEVLETRETIEEAQEEKDLDPLKETNEARIQDSIQVLEEAFKSDDMEAAKSEAVKLRYWVNIRESIDSWEQGKPVVLVH